MTEPLPCPFCGAAPIIHKHRDTPNAKEQGVSAGAWAQVECASDKCAMRIVKTHRCGSADDAVAIWNARG
jgi:hypothetical protein